jgi:Protein of unknown function (DUF5672)
MNGYMTRLLKMQRFGYLKAGVGNGGFSLRTSKMMYNIAKINAKKSGDMNEDAFFARSVNFSSWIHANVPYSALGSLIYTLIYTFMPVCLSVTWSGI